MGCRQKRRLQKEIIKVIISVSEESKPKNASLYTREAFFYIRILKTCIYSLFVFGIFLNSNIRNPVASINVRVSVTGAAYTMPLSPKK